MEKNRYGKARDEQNIILGAWSETGGFYNLIYLVLRQKLWILKKELFFNQQEGL